MANFSKGKNHPKYKHGEASVGKYRTGNQKMSRLYRAWHHLKDDKAIVICKEWAKSFTSFRDWATANGFDESSGVTHFQRKDRNYGWCPENTIVSPLVYSSRVFLTHDNITMSLCDWAKRLGITKQCLWARLYVLNWPVEKTLTEGVTLDAECTFD